MIRMHPFRRDDITGKDFWLCTWDNVLTDKNKDDEETKSQAAKLPGVLHCRWSHLADKPKGVKNRLVVWVDVESLDEFKAACKKKDFKFIVVPKNSGGSFPSQKKKDTGGTKRGNKI